VSGLNAGKGVRLRFRCSLQRAVGLIFSWLREALRALILPTGLGPCRLVEHCGGIFVGESFGHGKQSRAMSSSTLKTPHHSITPLQRRPRPLTQVNIHGLF
jgi:hypothetical protein